MEDTDAIELCYSPFWLVVSVFFDLFGWISSAFSSICFVGFLRAVAGGHGRCRTHVAGNHLLSFVRCVSTYIHVPVLDSKLERTEWV